MSKRTNEELVDLVKFQLRGLAAEVEVFSESVKSYAECISHIVSEIKEKSL